MKHFGIEITELFGGRTNIRDPFAPAQSHLVRLNTIVLWCYGMIAQSSICLSNSIQRFRVSWTAWR